jgi:antitoxin VapB
VAHELLVRDMDPVCLFTAADGRGERHRHPLPTEAVARKGFMLVCCARRHGLIASVTRHVAFEAPDTAAVDSYHRLLLVEKAFLDASTPGATLGHVVQQGSAEYGRQGFDPEEWQRHHQGGLSGVTPREYPAGPASGDVIQADSVLAWNPSAGPWKVEDTALVTGQGLRTLVRDEQWPTLTVGGRLRPGILVLN